MVLKRLPLGGGKEVIHKVTFFLTVVDTDEHGCDIDVCVGWAFYSELGSFRAPEISSLPPQ